MKYIFVLLLLLPVVMACPNGEYLRILRFGPSVPYTICNLIPNGYYICGKQHIPIQNGSYLTIDRICEKKCQPL